MRAIEDDEQLEAYYEGGEEGYDEMTAMDRLGGSNHDSASALMHLQCN